VTNERTETSWETSGIGSEGDDVNPEVERLTQEIEETRGGMSETLDELGQRLDPANIVAGAKETVREATVGKVEQMATSAGEMVSDAGTTARQTGEGLVETIKRNPVPAAMAGIGLGWLWMNRDKGQSMSWSQSRDGQGRYMSGYGASGYGTGYTGQGYGERSVGDRIGEAGEEIGRRASDVASTVGETASDVADKARMTAGQVPDQVGMVGQQVGDTAQRLMDENPLAVGAIALAVGAAVGLALPATRTEQKVIGNAGSKLIDQAGTAIKQPLEEAEQKLRDQEQTAQVNA
jgi:ElaB/YqjD/DUF883 family membrane-anchored ribosome-binding protein